MKFYIKLLLARKLDALIEIADAYVFHGDLEKIIEVTYSYRDIGDNCILNETIFEEYLGLSYPEYNLEYLSRRYKYKANIQIVLIDDILKKIEKIQVSSRAESLRRGLFMESLKYVKNILEISVLATDFELEKAGYDIGLSKTKIKQIITKIEKKEELAFGGKVIESSHEFSFCYNFIVKNHEEKRKNLCEKDRKAMKKYLDIIKKGAKCEIIDTPDIKIRNIKGNFLKKEILRKDYRKIFDSVCELYGLPQRTKITNAGSIYDGDHFLEIPRNEAFSSLTIERLLKLLTHEIESHYINTYNGKLLLGKFRGAKNLPKEEGLAMFMEKIFHGYTYDTIDNIIEYFFTMMAGECLDGEKFEDFMRIMGKEYQCKRNYTTAVIRAKRNYSLQEVGVQHKDVVYFRGLTELLNFLKAGGDFRKLFLGKVGFEDIENIETIYTAYKHKERLVYPIFISDLIHFYFIQKFEDENFEFSIPEYYLHLKKKYWFIDIESFSIIDHITKDWKKIERILKMLEKVIID